MKKIIIIALAVLLVSASAHAMMITRMGGGRAVANDKNAYRDHIDIDVRFVPEGGQLSASTNETTIGHCATATEGSVVVWSTHSTSVFGRDVTWTDIADKSTVAGIVSEPGGIASGDFGKIRIYGYFDDIIAADSTDAVAVGTQLATTTVTGQVGAGAGTGTATVGISLGAGSAADAAEIEGIVNVCN